MLNKNAISTMLAIATTSFAANANEVTAYVNGKIFTGSDTTDFVTSVIIENGKFSYVGNDAKSQVKEGVRGIDLAGKTVVPGLYDSHIHPIGGGGKILYDCNVSQEAQIDEVISGIEKCVDTIPGNGWITGGSWGVHVLDYASAELLAKFDKVSKGRPIAMYDFSHHNVWINSAAMKQLNITEEKVAEYGELVVRNDKDGFTGFFIEEASHIVNVPSRTEEQLYNSAKKAINVLNQYGIIGVKDSFVKTAEYQAWKALDDNGELTANVALSWRWTGDDKSLTFKQQQAKFKEMVQPSSGHIFSNFAKIGLDGIPPTKTAAMLEPYHPVEENKLGSMSYTQQDLAEAMGWLDQAGFTTQVHAVGDRAARTVLNAVESVRKKYGDSGLRHEVAHACIVEPGDISKFSKLNVVPNFSPIFWYPSPHQDGLEHLLGTERATRNCAMRTLFEDGALPTGGSDWPVSVDVNPWKAMESMITRKDPNDKRPNEVLWPEERISVEQAMLIYTINGAKALRIDENSGSIQVGKSADMLVLNQDIFSIKSENIGETKVITNIFEGTQIYSAQ